MKKIFVICGCMTLAALMMTGCKSKESAYKAAYDQAVAARQAQQQSATNLVTTQQVTPVEVTPVTPTTPVNTTPIKEPTVRTENVTLINGNGLKAYSVVVGSYSIQANAENQQADLKRAGYDAQVVLNPATNMYRVVATTHPDKASAIQSRNSLANTYTGAWLLYAK